MPAKTRQINDEGLELIKSFESCVLHPYKDAVGRWTIGWGHLIKANEDWLRKAPRITQLTADALLKEDLADSCYSVQHFITTEVSDNQFSALVSFCFNLGSTNLGRSTLLKKVNRNDLLASADEFLKWNKARNEEGKLIVMDGLTRRRKAEMDLFLK